MKNALTPDLVARNVLKLIDSVHTRRHGLQLATRFNQKLHR